MRNSSISLILIKLLIRHQTFFCSWKEISLWIYLFFRCLKLCLQHLLFLSFLHCFWWHVSNIYIILKITFFNDPIREYHLTIAMLYTFYPFSNIPAAISPYHFSMSMPLIILVLTSIYISTCPFKLALSTFLIICIFSYIFVCRLPRLFRSFFPFTLSVFQSTLEVAFIWASISPCIDTIPIRLTIFVFTSVIVSIMKKVSSFSMFQINIPFSFVLVSITPSKYTIT